MACTIKELVAWRAFDVSGPADRNIGDTAGWKICATSVEKFAFLEGIWRYYTRIHERNYSCRRCRITTFSVDACREQTVAACLRQANGLLSVDDVDRERGEGVLLD